MLRDVFTAIKFALSNTAQSSAQDRFNESIYCHKPRFNPECNSSFDGKSSALPGVNDLRGGLALHQRVIGIQTRDDLDPEWNERDRKISAARLKGIVRRAFHSGEFQLAARSIMAAGYGTGDCIGGVVRAVALNEGPDGELYVISDRKRELIVVDEVTYGKDEKGNGARMECDAHPIYEETIREWSESGQEDRVL